MPPQKGPFQKENKSFNHHFPGDKKAFGGLKGFSWWDFCSYVFRAKLSNRWIAAVSRSSKSCIATNSDSSISCSSMWMDVVSIPRQVAVMTMPFSASNFPEARSSSTRRLQEASYWAMQTFLWELADRRYSPCVAARTPWSLLLPTACWQYGTCALWRKRTWKGFRPLPGSHTNLPIWTHPSTSPCVATTSLRRIAAPHPRKPISTSGLGAPSCMAVCASGVERLSDHQNSFCGGCFVFHGGPCSSPSLTLPKWN